MQTQLAEFIRNTPAGDTAESILRKCVHCGFCTATCPTYQLLGDELDGPRGRIYLIKQMLEGGDVSARTQLHLDRCLTCRGCETTCPSGVEYGRLLDIGRDVVRQRVSRPVPAQVFRRVLRAVLPYPSRFGFLLKIGRGVRPLLPAILRGKIPMRIVYRAARPSTHTRSMLMLAGCVQPSLAPQINSAAAEFLAALGIGAVDAPNAGCCGAVSQHLDAHDEAKNFARRNIDAWWPHIENGTEAIAITASGCGAMLKEYAYILADDAQYAAKARRVAELCKDIAEIAAGENLSNAALNRGDGIRVAFQSPCTLQHGQKVVGIVERILTEQGYVVTPVADSHLCCGSAGTYSLLQPQLSRRLLENKIGALCVGQPAVIATANIGCWAHLQSATTLPIKHWVELVAPAET
ncbi:MAG: glycolate oxidase subunit GlcF [Gammaproteobacteria bacterium]|nr:glycolate oxidase subunit GlcF [Gammaproteobacteria bacterium]